MEHMVASRRRLRPFAAFVGAVALSVALSACTSANDGAPGSNATVTVTAPNAPAPSSATAPTSQVGTTLTTTVQPSSSPGIDPDRDRARLLGGLEPMLVVENDPERAISYAWPVIPNAGALNAAVKSWVDQQVAEFKRETSAGGVAQVELNISWQPVVVSGPLVAIRFDMHEFLGANGSRTTHTFFANTETGTIFTGPDLIQPTKRDAVAGEVVQALRAQGKQVFDSELDPDVVAQVLGALAFTPAGNPTFTLQGGVAPYSEGVMTAELSEDVVIESFSDVGRAFAVAATSPRAYTPPAVEPTTDPNAGTTQTGTSPADSTQTTAESSTGPASEPSTEPAPEPSAEPSQEPSPEPTPQTSDEPSEPSDDEPSAGPSAPSVPGAGRVNCQAVKCVALTFDDGPSKHTLRLLKSLQAAKAKATFYMLGDQAKAYPDVVQQVAAAGMEIGNHTVDHRNMARMSAEQQQAEVNDAAAAIEAAGGGRPATVRPPYGSMNDATRNLGVPLVLWSIDTEDWKNKNVAETTRRALAGVTGGSVILMHDIHPTTVDAVPGIVKQLKAAGYQLVTVSELFGGNLKPGTRYYSQSRVN